MAEAREAVPPILSGEAREPPFALLRTPDFGYQAACQIADEIPRNAAARRYLIPGITDEVLSSAAHLRARYAGLELDLPDAVTMALAGQFASGVPPAACRPVAHSRPTPPYQETSAWEGRLSSGSVARQWETTWMPGSTRLSPAKKRAKRSRVRSVSGTPCAR
jgi:hypothetical protein